MDPASAPFTSDNALRSATRNGSGTNLAKPAEQIVCDFRLMAEGILSDRF
jgi:hypothetical protein